jgi:hypothetical protein
MPVFVGVPFLGVRAGGNSLNTLLGFETTSPRRFFALCVGNRKRCSPLFRGWRPCCAGVVVVALLWWWGVVFDLWIVVASIERAMTLVPPALFRVFFRGGGGCAGVVVVVVCLMCNFIIGFVFVSV